MPPGRTTKHESIVVVLVLVVGTCSGTRTTRTIFRNHVIPAKAGIQQLLKNLDTGFRRCGAAGYNLAPDTYSQRTRVMRPAV